MKCDKARKNLPFIDDGSLEKDIVNITKAHLDECEECSKEYIETKRTLGLISSAFNKYESQAFLEISGAVKRKIDSRIRSKKVYKWAYSTAAILMCGILISIYSFIPKDIIDNNSYQMVMADQGEEFYSYIAEQYLDAFELYELVDEADVFYEYSYEDIMMQYDYLDVTLDDFIQTLNPDEITYLLNEIWSIEQ